MSGDPPQPTEPAARHATRWPAGVDAALAGGLGAVYSLSFVHTDAWWLALLCTGALAWRVGAAASRRAAMLGLAFSFAWLAGGTWWLFISMHRYGGLPAWLAAAAVAALCVFLALYLALAMALAARWCRGRALADALLFAALWLSAELARAALLSGFPWIASGYAQIDGPLAALAPWVGVYGIGFVAALLAALAAQGLVQGGAARTGPALALALAGLGAAIAAAASAGPFTETAGRASVTLLQTNVAQDEKFAAEHMPAAMQWLAQNLQQARGDIVIAPETAIPLLPAQLDPDWWDALRAHFRQGDRAALVGLPLGSFEAGYTNSVAGLSATAAALPEGHYRYDKHHLVPFGEFVPYGFRWFVDLMRMPLGDFSRGVLAAPSLPAAGQRIAPNICYEDLFGEELAARFADAASAPTMFANVSNIGWFGDTIAIDQHLNISRMRALEFERPMLRATNTGATAIIDHRGIVVRRLPAFTRGVLDGEVEGRVGMTPFARWAARAGLWPLAAFAAAVLAAVVWVPPGRQRPGP